MSDVFVTTHTPVLRSGRAVRTYGVVRALAQARGGVVVVHVRFGADEPDDAFRSIPGIELVAVTPSRGARRALAYARARARGVPDDFARAVSPELARVARAIVERERTGGDAAARLVADGPEAAAALAGLPRRLPLVYNAHNLESAFRHELSSPGLGSREALRRFERGLLERADLSWMVSPAELAAARELAPAAAVTVVPNVVDVARIAPVGPDVGAQRLLFVANFSYEPNRDGLRFLLDEVLPRLWRTLPQTRLRLVGAGLDSAPSSDQRVEAVGFVDDLADAYRDVSAAVVPLRKGGGTPLKFVEALAYGLPVVATPRAAAGLAVEDGVHCRLAEEPAAFAEALAGILRDGAPALAERGRALAEERYSIESLVPLVAPR